MSSKYSQKGVKTENRSTYTSQVFPRNNKGKYHVSYESKSPNVFYSKTKHEKEDSTNNSTMSSYTSKPRNSNVEQNASKKPPININQYKRHTEKRENYQRSTQDTSYQTLPTNHSIFFSDFSKIKRNSNNIESSKQYTQKPSNTLKRPVESKLNKNLNIHETHYSSSSNINNRRINAYTYSNDINKHRYNYSNSNSNNINNNTDYNIYKSRYNSNSNININNYKERKTVTHTGNLNYDNDKKNNTIFTKKEYNNKSYQGNNYNYPPKYYRNNTSNVSKNENQNNKVQNVEKKEDKYFHPVAQKICNIIIKGNPTKKIIIISKMII